MLAVVVLTAALMLTPTLFCVRKLPVSPSSKISPAAVSVFATLIEPPYTLIGPAILTALLSVMSDVLVVLPIVSPVTPELKVNVDGRV